MNERLQEIYDIIINRVYKDKNRECEKLLKPVMQVLMLHSEQFNSHLPVQFYWTPENNLSRFTVEGTSHTRAQYEYDLKHVENRRIITFSTGDREKNDSAVSLIHEITHLVTDILYANNCNPYFGNDPECSEMMQMAITEGLKRYEVAKNMPVDQRGEFMCDELYYAFEAYQEKDRAAELIVRPPQILVHYGIDDGLKILQQQAPKLLQFYKNYYLVDCNKFIQFMQLKLKARELDVNDETCSDKIEGNHPQEDIPREILSLKSRFKQLKEQGKQQGKVEQKSAPSKSKATFLRSRTWMWQQQPQLQPQVFKDEHNLQTGSKGPR